MKLYSSSDNYKLYEGDMFEFIEPNSIDVIVTDFCKYMGGLNKW